MSSADEIRQGQLDELEALRSVYEEDRVQYDPDAAPLQGYIIIQLEPFSKPATVHAICNGVEKFATVSALSPITMTFRLPAEYPSVVPELELESEWMNEEMLILLQSKLRNLCEEHMNEMMLFYCCQDVMDFVSEREQQLLDISLDDTPFARKKNIEGSAVLNSMKESSSKSEDHLFATTCFDCEVCFDNKMGRDCVQFLPCKHVFCQECVKMYFTERITGVQIKALECLSDECESPAPVAAIKQALGEDEYERYEQILLERAIGNMADVVNCPRSNCQKPCIMDLSNPRLGCCNACGLSFCIVCRRTYHGIAPCQFKTAEKLALLKKYDSATQEERVEMAKLWGGMEKLKKAIEDLHSNCWVADHSKPCPKCRSPIEKDSGCNKMHCTKCEIQFCWLCNKILPKDNPYGHFNGDGGCTNRLFEGVEDSDDEEDWFDEMHFARQQQEEDTDDELDFEDLSD